MGISAHGRMGDRDIVAHVVNPGGWFGKTWLVEIGGSLEPLFLVVEADTVGDVIDELADSSEHARHIVVEGNDLADYDPDTCHYGPSGEVIDLDWVQVHGAEGYGRDHMPWPCTYHGEDLPAAGTLPPAYDVDLLPQDT